MTHLVVERLRELARQEHTTLFSVLLAAFFSLLYRYTNEDDIVVGCPVAGRSRLETERLIGVFINTLPFRKQLSDRDTFRQVLQDVHRRVIEGLQHRDVPLQFIAQDVLTSRETSGAQLFQAMFIHERLPIYSRHSGPMVFEPEEADSVATMVDLTLETFESPSEVVARWVWRNKLWASETMARLAGHFVTLLTGIVVDPDQRICKLPLLTSDERHQIVMEWNDNGVDYPGDDCVHRLFEEQVARVPDAVAVVCEDQQLTYGKLNARANQLAHYLRSRGVGPGRLIGILLERSLDAVIGVLGVLKAGGAYLPLDPGDPAARLENLISDSNASVVLSHSSLEACLSEYDGSLVRLDAEWPSIEREAVTNSFRHVDPENLAYVIYTSGSTGNPKGVTVTHGALTSHCLAVRELYKLEADDRVLQFAALNFDASVEQIFTTLLAGARLILRDQVLWSTDALLEKVVTHGLTICELPAAYWNSLVQELHQGTLDISHLVSLRLAVVSGEQMPSEAVRRWQALPVKHIRLLNAYGPTEATITATSFDVPYDRSLDRVPIGRPLGSRQAYVLDAHGNVLSIGVPGELYLGGLGLARGYLNRPELTAEKFVSNPFNEDTESRLYRTGDLCRWRPDGNLEFLGRLDDQVKLRGFRIELGEIEAALDAHAEIAQSVVVLHEESGDKRLVAFCVVNPSSEVRKSELRSYVRGQLPEYMVPSSFEFLETIPLTSSGKVDRLALPTPLISRPDQETRYAAPRDSTEEQLAAIWSELLGLDRVGIHDNFFELGGHSLLTVQLFAQIMNTFGKTLPMATLFERSTICELAESISSTQDDRPFARMVPLRSEGIGRPLFLMPGISGEVLITRELYDALKTPVVGIQPSLKSEHVEHFRDFKQTAKRLTETLVEHQPDGPYALAGFSYGGLMAYEVACVLRALGMEVDLLIVVDTGPGRHATSHLPDRFMRAIRIVGNFPRWCREEYRRFSPADFAKRFSRFSRRIWRRFTSAGRTTTQFEEVFDETRVHPQNRALLRTAFTAARDYRPGRYDRKLTLIRAKTRPLLSGAPTDLGWGRLVDNVDVHVIDGDHDSILRSPNIERLGGTWDRLLQSRV